MITKSQFENTHKKYALSKCEIFFLKYFSVGSMSRNAWPVILIAVFLLLPFFITIFLRIDNIKISNWFYMVMLVIIGTLLMIIRYKRNKRIRLICDDLKITKKDYEKLINKYYERNYLDIKDYLSSIQ